MKAMDFAIEHCYERASVVTNKELLRQALRYGVADVIVEEIKRQLLRDELIQRNADHRLWFTTYQVLAEEKRLIEFVENGRGRFKPFGSPLQRSQTELLPMNNTRRSCTSWAAQIASRLCEAGRHRKN